MGQGTAEGVVTLPTKMEQTRLPARSLEKEVCRRDSRPEGQNSQQTAPSKSGAEASAQAGAPNLGRGGQRSDCLVQGTCRPTPQAGERPLVQKVHKRHPQLEAQGDGKVTVAGLVDLLIKQNYRCALSGRELTIENVTLDHITPFAKSDDHSIDNVHLVIREANLAKGAMSTGEFIRLCQDVAALHPRDHQDSSGSSVGTRPNGFPPPPLPRYI